MTVVAGTILFIAGAGIPLMAALNAGLGTRLGSPVPAAFLMFLLALAVTAVVVLINPLPTKADLEAIPARFFLGGLIIAFYVLSVTWLAPKVGLGNTILIVLLGQLVAASLIDHFALLGVPRAPITPLRLGGVGLIAAGIHLATTPVAPA